MAKQSPDSYRNHLREYFQSLYDKSLDKGSDVQRANAMLRFFVERILIPLEPTYVPQDDEDLEHCYTDASGDLKIDFIARTEGHVTIIQSKYHGPGKIESDSEFESFADVLFRAHPTNRGEYHVSKHLVDALDDVDWEQDHFTLLFISLGRRSLAIDARAKAGLRAHPRIANLPDRSKLEFLDESLLNERLKEALRANEEVSNASLLFSREGAEAPWIRYAGERGKRCFVGRISAAQIHELYKHHRTKLFEGNIRNWLGENSINKAIATTATDAPHDFFYFNNGISATACKIEEDLVNGRLECERLSIINGAQTTRSLHQAFQRNPDAVRSAQVLIRVSEVSNKRSATEQAFQSNITRHNNTQSVVKACDFRSNDPVQLSLRDHFDRLEARGGKKFEYQHKRTGDRKGQRIVIQLEELTKSIYSYRFGPFDAAGGTSYLFDPSEHGGYCRVFGDGHSTWTIMEPDDFKLIAGTWFLLEKAREVLKVQKEAPRFKDFARNALERRWLIYFLIGEYLRAAYAFHGRDLQLDTDIRQLCKHSRLAENSPTFLHVSDYTITAIESLVADYRTASSAAGFSQRNWYRDPSTLVRLRDSARQHSMILRGLKVLL